MGRRGALLIVVLALLGGAGAATAQGKSRSLAHTLTVKFVVGFSGTNTTSWTLGQGTGFHCDYGNSSTWPVAGGSGNQLISIVSTGPAKKRTLKLVFFYSGKTLTDVSVDLPLAGGNYGGQSFEVAQTDKRTGSITAPGSSNCLTGGPGNDFSLGGSSSLCGPFTASGLQGMAFGVEYDPKTDDPVIKKGGLEFDIGSGALGGTAHNPYYGGSLPDCPMAGDSYMPFFLPQLPAATDTTADDFLLFSHSTPDNLFEVQPSYAPFSLKELVTCSVKKLSTKGSGHDSYSGPFNWTDINSPPAGWAHWSATAALQWSMSLQRTSCRRAAG
jgi:hypothetical protein